MLLASAHHVLSQDVVASYADPSAAAFGPCDTRGAIAIYALHLYHIVFYRPLVFIDWLHHLVMVVVMLPLAYCLVPGHLLGHGAFYSSGLPGGIDYLMLVMVKRGWMKSIDEKSYNVPIQVCVYVFVCLCLVFVVSVVRGACAAYTAMAALRRSSHSMCFVWILRNFYGAKTLDAVLCHPPSCPQEVQHVLTPIRPLTCAAAMDPRTRLHRARLSHVAQLRRGAEARCRGAAGGAAAAAARVGVLVGRVGGDPQLLLERAVLPPARHRVPHAPHSGVQEGGREGRVGNGTHTPRHTPSPLDF